MVYKDIPLEVADLDESQGIVKGYGSIFGNVDSDGDIMMRSAYNKTLKENSERIKYCWQHNMQDPIGKFQELSVDDKGLMFVAKIAMESPMCADKFYRIKNGLADENSVGIQIVNKTTQEGTGYNELTEVKLFEISAVTMAANDLAKTLETKGFNHEAKVDFVSKRFESLTKFIKTENVTDQTGYAIEGELLALKTLIEELITKPSMSDTLPSIEKSEYDKAVEYLSQKFI